MVRSWNGWAEEADAPHLPGPAGRLLEALVGPAGPPHDATLEATAATVPPSRLPGDGISSDPVDRIRHATGQSFPDWVALRSGRVPVPDGVARPRTGAEVRDWLERARRGGWAVVPYGGGTSVVGGLRPPDGERPVLSLALERLSGLLAYEERSGLATFGAGTTGPELEAALAPHGMGLEHTPQSWERATVGGWVVTRSVGHQAIGVGRIDALFAGGTLEAPAGTTILPPHPASAAGPDLRQLVLGSEGRLGVLTEVVVRTRPRPEHDDVRAWLVPGWDAAVEAARALARALLPLSMIRLSTPLETATLFAMAGVPRATALGRRWLRLHGTTGEPALLIVAAGGRPRIVDAAIREAAALVEDHGAVRAPATIGRRWLATRYRSAGLRDTLWERGYGVDTLETATTWDRLPALAAEIGRGLRHGLDEAGERVHAFSHLSHVYGSGSSLYTTFIFRLARDPDETLDRWRRLKSLASETIVRHGATISHQHGVGRDHLPYLAAEKGALGLAALEAVRATFDPDRILNPGVLLPDPAG